MDVITTKYSLIFSISLSNQNDNNLMYALCFMLLNKAKTTTTQRIQLLSTWTGVTDDWLFRLHQVWFWADQVYNILIFWTYGSGQEGGHGAVTHR